jgi:hypothetical protein
MSIDEAEAARQDPISGARRRAEETKKDSREEAALCSQTRCQRACRGSRMKTFVAISHMMSHMISHFDISI